ncbi:LacI family DNA-binding transcriptional regulator [Parafilimonas sp.]|uniref:LacI family DNA-binding transcriptional regulator n=1 Tax=Parafilimonas sp. TaxID=1969739 RepID=UPI0039E6FB93
MKFETITIKDIAKALNLSVSTVSKALRKSYEISQETQKLVLDYAEKHNYKPNPVAQGLRKGKSRLIGVIVTNIDNNFFSQVINGIESVAHKKGYTVIITQTHESYEREVITAQNLMTRSPDGLLVSLCAETANVDHFKEIHHKGLPIVFFDRVTNDIDTHKVTCNNFHGAYEATKHLAQQGFQRIAHITSSNNLSITLERLEGYLKALEDNGLQIDERYIKYCVHGGMIQEETRAAVNELLAMHDKPDAIFTASDRLSTTTFSILCEEGIKMPVQMGMAGFTNSLSAHIFNPPLTTIVQPAFEMGQKATEMLIQLIESKQPPARYEKKVLDAALVIRQSSLKKKILRKAAAD